MVGLVRALAVVSVLLLAGCVSDTPDAKDDAAPEGSHIEVDPETGATRVVRSDVVTFGGVERVRHTENLTGRFEFGDQWDQTGDVLTAAGAPPDSAQVFDVSDRIPKGVPVWMAVEVDIDLAEGDVDLWINAPFDEIWSATFDTPRGGYSRVEYTMVHTSDDPIEVIIFYDEREGTDAFDYQILMEINVDDRYLYAGVPVKVPVPAGATALELEFVTSEGEAWIWAPDDSFLGVFTPEEGKVNLTIPAGARPGDYIVGIPEETGPAQVRIYRTVERDAEAAQPTFGLVTQDIQPTDAKAIVAGEPATLTFNVDRVPLQVGLQIVIDQYTHGVAVSLSNADGTVFDISFQDTVPFFTMNPDGMQMTFLSDLLEDGIVAGEYTGTFTGDPHGEGEISAWIVHYKR